MNTIKLILDGEPVAASRPRVTRKGWAYTPAKYEAYKQRIKFDIQSQYHGELLTKAVAVKVVFYRSVQKSVSKVERERRLSNEHPPVVKDVERRDATVFKTKAEAETEATIVHDMFSSLGLGINFIVEENNEEDC
ncbi:RusA family crossover junction endodeoxyribonuclease [Pediococcus acidilactici]